MLWMCGMPGLTPGDLIDIDMDAVDGEGVIHLSNADYLTRPLRLSADEALALVLALRTLREIAGPGKRAAIDSALRKLDAVAGSAAHGEQAAVAVTAAQDEIQARVNDGLQRGKRLDLTYDVATRAETTRREVDPLRVFVLEGYGYLEAWCYSAQALRTFRLDRIAAVEVTDDDVERPRRGSAGPVQRLVRGAPGRAAGHPGAAARRRRGWPSTTRTRASVRRRRQRRQVTMRVTDPAWLRGSAAAAGRRGPGARPRPGAGRSAAEAAQEALDQYAAVSTPS